MDRDAGRVTSAGQASAPGPRMECGICWTVYDPAIGDDFGAIAAGTPFSELPAHWCCPNCEAPPAKFLRVQP